MVKLKKFFLPVAIITVIYGVGGICFVGLFYVECLLGKPILPQQFYLILLAVLVISCFILALFLFSLSTLSREKRPIRRIGLVFLMQGVVVIGLGILMRKIPLVGSRLYIAAWVFVLAFMIGLSWLMYTVNKHRQYFLKALISKL